MGLEVSRKNHQQLNQTFAQAYSTVVGLQLNRSQKTLSVVIATFADKATYQAWLADPRSVSPIEQVQVNVGPVRQIIQPAIPNPATGEILVQEIAMPGWDDLGLDAVFNKIKQDIYSICKADPRFKDAKDSA